jgi:NAD(P)-dependent dehydrogenase (short-subunit alcohol dehydrogenase family)
MHDMTRLNGKTAVITGGATGIGRAAAKRFVEEGAFVFLFGRRQEALDAAVADLGPNARAVKGSVSDEADLDRLYAAVKPSAELSTLSLPMPGREASLRSARSPPSTSTRPSTPM